MKKSIAILAAALSLTVAAVAVADLPEKVYENEALGNVTFHHETHLAQGLQCGDCHPGTFDQDPSTSMANHETCGTCHTQDGRAFPTAGEGAVCTNCHKKE